MWLLYRFDAVELSVATPGGDISQDALRKFSFCSHFAYGVIGGYKVYSCIGDPSESTRIGSHI